MPTLRFQSIATPFFTSLLAAMPLLAACGSSGGAAPAPVGDPRPESVTLAARDVRLRFAVTVGSEPFRCGASYEGVGKSKSTLQPIDLRLYVHDVALVARDGSAHAVALTDDDKWQGGGVALLDFTDGEGLCSAGNPKTNTELVGTVAEGDYVGVRFVLGVPDAQNHLDLASAQAPLDVPGLYWGWAMGYRYMTLDVRATGNSSYYFHPGASGCERADSGDYGCTAPNLAAITLDGFDASADVIAMDLAALYAGVDLDAQPDGVIDFVPGCMSETTDPECAPMFAALGLSFPDPSAAAPAQTVFGVRKGH